MRGGESKGTDTITGTLPVQKIHPHPARNLGVAPDFRQKLCEIERAYSIRNVVESYSLGSLDERHVALNYRYWYRHVLLFEYQ